MPVFTYQARDEGGRPIRGILEAESPAALADKLRKMGYLLTRMEEGKAAAEAAAGARSGRKSSSKQLLLAMVQLSNLVEAGIPLVSALRSIAEQTAPGALKHGLEGVAREIEGGEPFSEGLKRRPEVFPPLLTNLVKVGEVTGKLDLVLVRFALFLERDITLKESLQGAVTYPAVLLVTSLFTILLVVTFVVPQFAQLFAKAGIQLPGPTLLLSGIGQGLRQHFVLILLALFAVFSGLAAALRSPSLRSLLDALILRLPVIGPLVYQTLVARLARSLSTLVGSGIPILAALEMGGGIAGNAVVVKEMGRVRQGVERGERIAVALAAGKWFQPDVVQMVQAGEDSGRLDVMLGKVADFYDRRVNFTLKQLTTLLEPFLLLVMGGIIALIMASLLMPMFDMVRVLNRGGLR